MSEFLVIGVGLPRTGTLSIKTALERLLNGKCHHFFGIYEHQDVWTNICDGKTSDEELKEFILSNKYVAGVDSPIIFHYERLMKIFPHAKILISIRDPTAWVKSINSTVAQVSTNYKKFPAVIFHWCRFITKYLPGSTVMLGNLDKIPEYRDLVTSCINGTGEEFFENWTNRIISTVPKEKLLIFNVKEGWEPLCKFLDVPIPEEPFPRVNDTNAFKKYNHDDREKWMKYYGQFIITILIAAVGLFIYYQFESL